MQAHHEGERDTRAQRVQRVSGGGNRTCQCRWRESWHLGSCVDVGGADLEVSPLVREGGREREHREEGEELRRGVCSPHHWSLRGHLFADDAINVSFMSLISEWRWLSPQMGKSDKSFIMEALAFYNYCCMFQQIGNVSSNHTGKRNK